MGSRPHGGPSLPGTERPHTQHARTRAGGGHVCPHAGSPTRRCPRTRAEGPPGSRRQAGLSCPCLHTQSQRDYFPLRPSKRFHQNSDANKGHRRAHKNFAVSESHRVTRGRGPQHSVAVALVGPHGDTDDLGCARSMTVSDSAVTDGRCNRRWHALPRRVGVYVRLCPCTPPTGVQTGTGRGRPRTANGDPRGSAAGLNGEHGVPAHCTLPPPDVVTHFSLRGTALPVSL